MGQKTVMKTLNQKQYKIPLFMLILQFTTQFNIIHIKFGCTWLTIADQRSTNVVH